MKYKAKHKEQMQILKYTEENQKFILDLLGDFGDLDPEVKLGPDYKPQGNIWVSNWDGGDILKFGDYLGFDGEFYVAKNFEDNFKFIGKYTEDKLEIWEETDYKEIEALQWTGDNTEECKEFIGEDGGLDASGQQIILGNFRGGSLCEKGDYIVKFEGNLFSCDEKSLKKNFKAIY